jgi:hypothetical protein
MRYFPNAFARLDSRMKVLEYQSIGWGDHVDNEAKGSPGSYA